MDKGGISKPAGHLLDVPEPVLLNNLKHHLGYIRTFIEEMADKGESGIEKLPAILLSIGESQMDLYTGKLSPARIAGEIIQQLHERGIFGQPVYKTWLKDENEGFATMILSDGSIWVLRIGEQAGRYVHIHPGRYSPHTIRVRASVLKTAIAVACVARIEDEQDMDLKYINRIRQRVLHASPVKYVSDTEGIGKLLVLLNNAQ